MSDHSELCTLSRLSHTPPSHAANLIAPQLDQRLRAPSFPPPPTRSARKSLKCRIILSCALSHSPPSHVANLTAPQLDQIFQTPARTSFPPPPTRSREKLGPLCDHSEAFAPKPHAAVTCSKSHSSSTRPDLPNACAHVISTAANAISVKN